MIEMKHSSLNVNTTTMDNASIVVPVFNEELILEKSIYKLLTFCNSFLDCDWELIIADNASTDMTGEIGRRLAANNDRIKYLHTDKKGVGAALKMAWASSSFDVLCYTDVDLPFPLESLIEQCKAVSNGHDIAIGSRYVAGGYYNVNLGRKILSKLYRYWLKIMFSCKFNDHCGTKAIKKKVFLDLIPMINCNDWFFGTELLVLAEKKGYTIKEIPVSAQNDSSRNSKVKLLRTIWDYVKLSLSLKWDLFTNARLNRSSSTRSSNFLGKGFVIVTHRFVVSPGDFMLPFLRAKLASVMYIMHSFADKKDRISSYLRSEQNFPEVRGQTRDYKRFPEPLVLMKNSFFNLFWILRSKRRWDFYIGVDGLSSFSGIILRALGMVRKVVYWSTDFVPNKRFNSGLMNTIYQEVNKYSLKKCDHAWNLSPRMSEGRAKLLGWTSEEFSKQIVVPWGVWSEKRGLVPLEKINPYTLVFLGHLLEKQGVQLVLKAVPKIVQEIPDFQFLVIGTGPYEEKLKQMVKDLRIEKYVTFTGLIKSHDEVDDLMSQCALAAAPYDITKDTWTYWADPGKFKNYFATSLPVILTPVSYNAMEIHKRHCGIVINYDKDEFAKAVCSLMLNKDLLQEYRFNAYEYSLKFDWSKIFNYAFSTVLDS